MKYGEGHTGRVYATVGRERRHINTQRGKERERERESVCVCERERVCVCERERESRADQHDSDWTQCDNVQNGKSASAADRTAAAQQPTYYIYIQRPVLVSRACERVVQTKRGAPNIKLSDFIFRQSDLLLLLCDLLAPLAPSLSRRVLTSPYCVLELVFRVPQRAGCRAVVGPCRPRIKGPLHARSPGPQVIFRPHPTYPLMQSSDAVVGYSSVAVDVSLVVVASSCPIITCKP